jgi:hypothetical protein
MPFLRSEAEEPAAHAAKAMHEVFVKQRSRNRFNPDRFFIPMPYKSPFTDRIYLYCEAIVFYTLVGERQFDPKYEELLVEYENIICPAEPNEEALAKAKKIKAAVNDVTKLFREDMTPAWAWCWFQAIGYRNVDPLALTLLLNGFSTTAYGVKESLQKMRAGGPGWK